MSKQIVVLWAERYFPIDTRSDRLLRTLEKSGRFKLEVCAWDRGYESRDYPPNYHVLHTSIGYKRPVLKFANLPRYRAFLRKKIQEITPDVICCSFWDMAFLISTISTPNIKVIYDVIDMPGGSGLYFKIGRCLETYALKKVNGIVLSSRYFRDWYDSLSANTIVIENLPDLEPVALNNESTPKTIRFAYVGTVRHPETLRSVISVFTELRQVFHIYGDGPDLALLKSEANNSPFVKFFGRYEYSELSEIYASIDVLWAAYPLNEVNNRFAISNKYYESLLFDVPAIFSLGTRLGAHVSELDIGFCINAENIEVVRDLVSSLVKNPSQINDVRSRILRYRKNVQMNWKDQEDDIVHFFEKIICSTE